MTILLVDSSVLVKWFHAQDEPELAEARAIRDAHTVGDVDARVLDLAIYEIGNVLARSLGWSPEAVAEQLDDLLTIVGRPLTLTPEWRSDAAVLCARHRLTFYDAAWAAAARGLAIPLLSTDQQLLAANLAESPTAFVRRVGLI